MKIFSSFYSFFIRTYLIKHNKFAFSRSELILSLVIMVIRSKKCSFFVLIDIHTNRRYTGCDDDFYIGENDDDKHKRKEPREKHTDRFFFLFEHRKKKKKKRVCMIIKQQLERENVERHRAQ